LGQYCRIKGLGSRRDEWKKFGEGFKEGPIATGLTGKQFAYEAYRLKNSIKHMSTDQNDEFIEIDLKNESARYIRQAYDNASKLALEHLLSKDVHQIIEDTTEYVYVDA
jgi:hypothetical protein